MKWLVASDLHGSADACRDLLAVRERKATARVTRALKEKATLPGGFFLCVYAKFSLFQRPEINRKSVVKNRQSKHCSPLANR